MVRRVFALSGYPLSCENACTCAHVNPINAVQTMLNLAQLDNSLYSNNSICSNMYVYAAMTYLTAQLPCESVMRLVQTNLIRLCGTQNGVSCMGRCTEQYQIDMPRRPCDLRQDADTRSRFVFTVGIVLGCIVFLWAPSSEDDTPMQHTPVKHTSTSVSIADLLQYE